MQAETQTAQILSFMRAGHAITPMLALKKFGSFRLGARIWDLRQRGAVIDRKWRSDGRRKRWAVYRMVKGPKS